MRDKNAMPTKIVVATIMCKNSLRKVCMGVSPRSRFDFESLIEGYAGQAE